MTNKKCEICGKTAHHLHHKDENHKNNKPDNLQYLCTLCHAKVHGISPNISELRKRIDYYKRAQKTRITFEHYLRDYGWMELIPPKEIIKILPTLEKLEKQSEKNIKEYFKNEKNRPPIYDWLLSIKGISDILAGQLIAYININKTPGIANLWSYTGLAPNQQRRKKKDCHWNHKLKSVCYLISDSFIKQRTPKYRDIYDKEKEKQIPICQALDKKGWKGHADNRARRKAVKIFLKDLWIEWNGERISRRA